jgi:hypothetical protein
MAESGRCLSVVGNISRISADLHPPGEHNSYERGKLNQALKLTTALMMITLGAGLTGLICLSGSWGIGHMWPVLMLSVPLLVIGIYLFRLGFKVKRSSVSPDADFQK